jgi:hypothetical protein
MLRKPSNQPCKLASCIAEDNSCLEIVPEEMPNRGLVQGSTKDGMMVASQALVYATTGAEASSVPATREPARHVLPGHHISIPLVDLSNLATATRAPLSVP